MINSSLSNTMILIGNLDLGHLIDTLNFLAGPCDYCVSPSGFFKLGLRTWSGLRVRIWGLLGQGIGDFDSGLTKFLCYAIVSQ